MSLPERRRRPRVRRYHLTAFSHYNGQGYLKAQSLARTLDISPGGILLETVEPMAPEDRVVLEVQVGDHILPLQGIVVHGEVLPNGHYRVGIAFQEVAAEVIAAITAELDGRRPAEEDPDVC